MTAGRDFLLFILFLIVLGIAWFLTGGPNRTVSHSGWFVSGSGIPVPIVGASSTGAYGGEFGGGAFTGSAGDSPYSANVVLEKANASEGDPAKEYLIIRTSPSLQSAITITGWTLTSTETGAKAKLNGAANTFTLGQVNNETPVSVGPNSAVYVVTGRPPNGVSFRVNECSGYLGENQTFWPALQKQCPTASDELVRVGGGKDTACVNFASTVQTCSSTQPSQSTGDACRNFAGSFLSYNGCVSAHSNEPGFYKSEWRLFLNGTRELWGNTHDTINLLDENGKVVSSLSY